MSRPHRPVLDRFNEKYTPEPFSGCWLWTAFADIRGYGRFLGADGKAGLASRTSWLLFKGDIPNGLCVLHHCDTPSCVNPDHLFLGTRADNNHDAISKGRANPSGGNWPKGERHPLHKLTAAQVADIRRDPRKYKDLANAYAVSLATINAIRQRKIWRHLA